MSFAKNFLWNSYFPQLLITVPLNILYKIKPFRYLVSFNILSLSACFNLSWLLLRSVLQLSSWYFSFLASWLWYFEKMHCDRHASSGARVPGLKFWLHHYLLGDLGKSFSGFMCNMEIKIVPHNRVVVRT